MSRATSKRGRVVSLSLVSLPAVLLLAGGCAYRMATPASFAKVSPWYADFRALTPEEDKLRVRHFSVPEKQAAAFWVESVRNQLVEDRGYTLRDEGEFKTGNGRVGHRFRFELSMGEVPYCYELAVFSTRGWLNGHIYTVEFLCAKKNYDKYAPGVEQALRQFRPRRGR